MSIFHSELLWVAVSAFLFVAIFYKKISAALFSNLDDRRENIEQELDEALSLKEQAKKLLSEARHKQKNAEIQAEKILLHAKEDAESIINNANRDLTDMIERRTNEALKKISHYENAVIQDIHDTALDMAINAVRDALKKEDEIYAQDSAISALKVIQKKMN